MSERDEQPDPSAAGEGEPAHDDPDSSTPSGDMDDEGDEVENRAAQKASREAAKWRTKFREAEQRLAALESGGGDDEVRLLRIRLAFERHAKAVNDLDAAWRLVQDDLAAVDLDDDGTPDADRVSEIVAHVQQRYPYLCDAPSAADGGSTPTKPAQPSGRATNGRKKPTDTGPDFATLATKFPALRGRS